jgi:hypothetical protein
VLNPIPSPLNPVVQSRLPRYLATMLPRIKHEYYELTPDVMPVMEATLRWGYFLWGSSMRAPFKAGVREKKPAGLKSRPIS